MPTPSVRSIALCASLAFLFLAGCDKSGAPTWGTPPSPPADAKFIEFPEMDDSRAEWIIADVTSRRGDAAQQAAADAYAGLWIPATGWRGNIEKIHEGDGMTTLWMRYTTSANPLSGGFLVALQLPVNDRQPTVASDITFSGRVEEVRIINAGAVPEYQIIVKDGRVLTVGGK